VRRLWRLIVVAVVWSFARRPAGDGDGDGADGPPGDRIVPPGAPAPRAEIVVAALLGLAALAAIAFIVVYAVDRIPDQTQYLGLALGAAFGFLAAALIVTGRHLVVTEELEGEYAEPEPEAAARVAQIVTESGSHLRRRRLLATAAGAASAAVGLAVLVPAASLGPVYDLGRFTRTPWRRGRRLVDQYGHPIPASAISTLEPFTAFPEHADPEEIGSPIVLVRLEAGQLHLPAARRGWAPQGIVAYSKICTHAGCAVALYRKPLFPPVDKPPGLVCPCHYSTFDPATGGTVVFGPAGRPLPQLPLTIDRDGNLRASGTFSGPVGPSWWGVRNRKASA
jgi:ubiquinol-cytochrome c reductase iron-sulfur subunit